MASTHHTPRPGATGRRGRRNKPTLNCHECVGRKIRCDRGRPRCTACIRRMVPCKYNAHAELIVSLDSQPNAAARSTATALSSTRRFSHDHHDIFSSGHEAFSPDEQSFSDDSLSGPTLSSVSASASASVPTPAPAPAPVAIQQSAPEVSSNMSFRRLPTLEVYGTISEHPFFNYWTMTGGIAELVSVLPSRTEADCLVAHYFDAVDPLYPILDRPDFQEQHAQFWDLPPNDMVQYDADKLALFFVLYAVGAQFMEGRTEQDRTQLSSFYLSASYQSLCLYSYFSRCSVASLQCIILIGYYLINKNLLSDAWTFTGIAQRQGYGLELNLRQPELLSISNVTETRLRQILWQAMVIQDVTLALYLQRPSTAVCFDLATESEILNADSQPSQGIDDSDDDSSVQDLDHAYLNAMWEYAVFTQQHICRPRALRRPICDSRAHKSDLITRFTQMHNTWRAPFSSRDPRRFVNAPPRLARQMIALSSNYFGSLLLLYMDENHDQDVSCDYYEALSAAREALNAFFALVRLCPRHAHIWGGHNIRAYVQATAIGNLLARVSGTAMDTIDSRVLLAKTAFDRYVDVLSFAQSAEGSDAFIYGARIRALQLLEQSINLT